MLFFHERLDVDPLSGYLVLAQINFIGYFSFIVVLLYDNNVAAPSSAIVRVCDPCGVTAFATFTEYKNPLGKTDTVRTKSPSKNIKLFHLVFSCLFFLVLSANAVPFRVRLITIYTFSPSVSTVLPDFSENFYHAVAILSPRPLLPNAAPTFRNGIRDPLSAPRYICDSPRR